MALDITTEQREAALAAGIELGRGLMVEKRATVEAAPIEATWVDPPFPRSTNDWTDANTPDKPQVFSGGARGKLLFLPRTGLVVVPHTMHSHGWGCLVVRGDDRYPQGGYDIEVGDREIVTAHELSVTVNGDPGVKVY